VQQALELPQEVQQRQQGLEAMLEPLGWPQEVLEQQVAD
jgi:hypothetical protein